MPSDNLESFIADSKKILNVASKLERLIFLIFCGYLLYNRSVGDVQYLRPQPQDLPLNATHAEVIERLNQVQNDVSNVGFSLDVFLLWSLVLAGLTAGTVLLRGCSSLETAYQNRSAASRSALINSTSQGNTLIASGGVSATTYQSAGVDEKSNVTRIGIGVLETDEKEDKSSPQPNGCLKFLVG